MSDFHPLILELKPYTVPLLLFIIYHAEVIL